MRKTKKLSLHRETLLHLSPEGMSEAAGGVTAFTHCVTCPVTQCNLSICVQSCKCTRPPCPP